MPVGADRDYNFKREILNRVAERHRCTLHLPLEQTKGSKEFDLLRALQDIADARLVVADLSLERPSCYYELGLAQALHKRTVLIAREGTAIHQAYGRGDVRYFTNDRAYETLWDELLIEDVGVTT
jgi:hypothetical protein